MGGSFASSRISSALSLSTLAGFIPGYISLTQKKKNKNGKKISHAGFDRVAAEVAALVGTMREGGCVAVAGSVVNVKKEREEEMWEEEEEEEIVEEEVELEEEEEERIEEEESKRR